MASIFILVYVRIDMVMLEAMGRPMQELGWYGAAVKLVDAVGMAPALAAGALLPVIASLTARRRDEAVKLFRQGQRPAFALGAAGRGRALHAAHSGQRLFVRPQIHRYAGGLCLAGSHVGGVFFLNHLQLAMLTALGRQNVVARATGLCALLNVALNLLLIPGYGFMGAAAATCGTETVLCAQCALTLRGEIGRGGLLAGLWPPLTASGVMVLLLWGIGTWPLWAALPLGAAAYVGVLALLGGLPWKELKNLLGQTRGISQKV